MEKYKLCGHINHDTEMLHCKAVSRVVVNAMSCMTGTSYTMLPCYTVPDDTCLAGGFDFAYLWYLARVRVLCALISWGLLSIAVVRDFSWLSQKPIKIKKTFPYCATSSYQSQSSLSKVLDSICWSSSVSRRTLCIYVVFCVFFIRTVSKEGLVRVW